MITIKHISDKGLFKNISWTYKRLL